MNHWKRVLDRKLEACTPTVNEIASPKFAEGLAKAD